MKNSIRISGLLFCLALLSGVCARAQQPKKHSHHKGAMYISWGYNTEWYTNSTVHVKQDAIGSNYNLLHAKANDHRGWDKNLLHQQLSIPQYNWRIGYYFNDSKDLGVELNFDHTKYIITEDQNIRVKGTLNFAHIDSTILFNQANGFFYYLNNGANFLLFNLVKRQPLYHTNDNYLGIDLVCKAGIGPVVPHVQNSFFGHPNQQHFQLGGWNAGLETALRVTILRYGFLEFSQKVDYARYSGLKIYNGTARQSFGTYELILSAGAIWPTHSNNPMFHNKVKKEE